MGATSGVIAKCLSEQLGLTLSACNYYGQRLRDEGLLIKGGVGGAGALLQSDDVTNWLISLVASKSIASAAQSVIESRNDLVRQQHFVSAVRKQEISSLYGLTIGDARCAASAIDTLLDDMRSGAFSKWLGEVDTFERVSLRADFIDFGRRIEIEIMRPRIPGAWAHLAYGRKRVDPMLPLTRIHRVHGVVFKSLAEALGPLP